MKTIKCPKCGSEMVVFGTTEDGTLKYHCAECYFVTERQNKEPENEPEKNEK